MLIPTEILVIALLVGVLLVVALVASIRAERRAKAAFHARLTVPRPDAAPAVPAPGPHEHVWSTEPTAVKDYWREYACTVPGCTADPLTIAGTRR